MLDVCLCLAFDVLLQGAAARLINITIDDTNPGILYSPSDDWSYGPTCTTCTANVTASNTYNKTWHDTLFSPSFAPENHTQTVEFSFTGSAIYVFGILSNGGGDASGNADQVFFIDGGRVGNFTHITTGDGTFVYNSTLYANSTLPYGNHVLKMQNGQPQDVSSLILFDYMVYSVDDDGTLPQSNPPSTSSSTSTGTSVIPSSTGSLSPSTTTPHASPSLERNKILLGVFIPLLVILLGIACALYLCCWRTRTRRHRDHISIASPFLSPLSEVGNATTVSVTSKGGGAIDPASEGSGLTDVSSTVVPSSPSRKFRPVMTTRNALENDDMSLTSRSVPSAINANLSRQPSTTFSAPGVGPSNEAVFAPFSQVPNHSSHYEQAPGTQTMQPIVFAPISIQQLSGATGYPLLTTWPQAIGRREDDSAPPAYASEAG